MDIQEQIEKNVGEAIKKSLDSYLGGYQSPLNPIIAQVVKKHKPKLVEAVSSALDSLTSSESFKKELIEALNAKLARTIISKMDGELEKRLNDLRANPTTRARITLAIEKIVKETIEKP